MANAFKGAEEPRGLAFLNKYCTYIKIKNTGFKLSALLKRMKVLLIFS